jgi:hypothetical protein
VREMWNDAVALYLRKQCSLPQAQFAGEKKLPQLPRLQEPLRYLCTWLPPLARWCAFPLAG